MRRCRAREITSGRGVPHGGAVNRSANGKHHERREHDKCVMSTTGKRQRRNPHVTTDLAPPEPVTTLGVPISNAGQSRNARSGRRPLVVGQLPGPNHEVCVEQFVFLGLNDIDDYESSPCQRVADKRNFSAIGFDDLVEVTQTRSWLGIQWNACEITTAVNSPRVEDRSSRSSEPPTTNERWSAPAASARICGWTSTGRMSASSSPRCRRSSGWRWYWTTVGRSHCGDLPELLRGRRVRRNMDGRTRQCARA